MGALVKLQDEGKIGAIGVSNFTGEQIEEALCFGRIESLQPPYSLFFQPYVENNTIEVCQKHNIGVIPYSPLAQGLVTGKFTHENRPTDNRANNHIFKDPTYSMALEAVEKLKPISAKYGATTAQVALAWLIAQPGITSPIVGARNAEQIRDTAKAADLVLEANDLQVISQLATPVLDSQPADKTNPWAG
jgi:aryl-alcohol dehydrogenase-like predicted oxidoreductase